MEVAVILKFGFDKLKCGTLGDVGVHIHQVKRTQRVVGWYGHIFEFVFKVNAVLDMVLCVTH